MKYHFSELIDANRLQRLMDSFYEMTGIPSTLIDPQGVILKVSGDKFLGSGWRKLCLNFHRKHPEALAKCIESDTVLSLQAKGNKQFSLYKCKNGLVDGAYPIYVEGEHVVNLFTGQFFLEPPDINFFRKQAIHYGFDMEEYLEALSEIPILDERKLEQGLMFFGTLAELITLMSIKSKDILDLNNELEQRVEARTHELEKALSEIKTLKGILPLCSSCKKIRDDKGHWENVDVYINQHSQADITHGLCPDCAEKLYPEFYKKK